mmetsp:Transcript_52304/g.131360  ORF Transcript_52304/g.131360 Transcript_52304/m.131360 type:complete len:198 (-) Transcript_52304:47-640(-)
MSCYVIGKHNRDSKVVEALNQTLPIRCALKDGQKIVISEFSRDAEENDVDTLMQMLNAEIRSGTYPQDKELDRAGFLNYYCSEYTFVARTAADPQQICGAFYVKRNFPGRCSHICNSGFLVREGHRGNGVGKALAQAFLAVAPLLGFKAAFFNLVFVDNHASVALWDGLGFNRTGRVPAAKIQDGRPVDALMYYKAF